MPIKTWKMKTWKIKTLKNKKDVIKTSFFNWAKTESGDGLAQFGQFSCAGFDVPILMG